MKLKQSVYITATLLAVLGCSPKTGTVSVEDAEFLSFAWWCNGGEEKSRIIYEIETSPKATYRNTVINSSMLTHEEKKIIADTISPDAYTHATLKKAEYQNAQFLVIDQFNPLRIVGKDSEGREIIEGGSGTLELIPLGATGVIQRCVTYYDW